MILRVAIDGAGGGGQAGTCSDSYLTALSVFQEHKCRSSSQWQSRQPCQGGLRGECISANSCCNKRPQTWWLKTKPTFIFMILDIKSPKWISLGHIQGGGMAALLLEAPGSIGFLAFPASRGHLHSMAPNPGGFSIFRARHTSLWLLLLWSYLFYFDSFFDFGLPASPSERLISLVTHPNNQESPPHLGILNTIFGVPFAMKKISRFWGLGDIICLPRGDWSLEYSSVTYWLWAFSWVMTV